MNAQDADIAKKSLKLRLHFFQIWKQTSFSSSPVKSCPPLKLAFELYSKIRRILEIDLSLKILPTLEWRRWICSEKHFRKRSDFSSWRIAVLAVSHLWQDRS